MRTPFSNDMFSLVYMAFRNLYPDKECRCRWAPSMESADDGSEVFGATTFAEDGLVFIDISARLTVGDAVEVFAHELAHVAAGRSDEEHNQDWQDAFDAIFIEYERIGNNLLKEAMT